MPNYNVTITDGTGSQAIQNGTYDVSAVVTGYDASTLSPTTFTADGTASTNAFTISADGTLTFNVNETGAAGGTPITAGEIVMTNQDGSVEYGSPVAIGADGNAVFANVPYDTAGYTLYFRQLSSDPTHNPTTGVITVNMTSQAQTEYIENSAAAVETFTLADANYPGLPVNGTLNLTEQA